jgi:3-phosphoshikimate 1-carboxyvinyltransferase
MTLGLSQALTAAPRLRGSLELPSDKSIAHRALICAALATGDSGIRLRQPGADVLSTISALRSLGVDVSYDGGIVQATGLERLGPGVADCGNSGTSMRLLAGALAHGSGSAILTGDESLSRRPMARVGDPLRAMGAEISLNEGHAPIIVRGRRPLRAMDHHLQMASAQVLGSICLAALAAEGTTIVRAPGEVRDHSERMLAALGADIDRSDDRDGTTTTLRGPTRLRAFELDIPGDFSSASAWLVAGALHADADIRIHGVGLNPTRTALVDVLRSMGADVRTRVTEQRAGEPVGEIEVRGGSSLSAVSLGAADVAPLIDELPLLAVAMAAAKGTSEVRGAQELRVKESDRIAAIGAALTAAGANFEELSDGWRISRGTPRDAQIVTYGDHRIAMAMAIAAWTGVAASVGLDDPDCVAVSYPSFWDDARVVGALA